MTMMTAFFFSKASWKKTMRSWSSWERMCSSRRADCLALVLPGTNLAAKSSRLLFSVTLRRYEKAPLQCSDGGKEG